MSLYPSDEEIAYEQAVSLHVERLIDAIAQQVAQYPSLYRWGDGEGGWLHRRLTEALERYGLVPPVLRSTSKKKATIDGRLRTAVFERDLYRCVNCGSHLNLCADHIYPESLGGATTLENLQTLCRPCNSSKGARL